MTSAPPPSVQDTPLTWLRKNLFSNWFSSLLTVLILLGLVQMVRGTWTWASTAARWDVIPANLHLFFAGRLPPDQYWRLWILLGLISLLSGISWGRLARSADRLFSPQILIGLAGLSIFTILIPTPWPYRTLILAQWLVVAIAAWGGQWLDRQFPGLERWLTLGWFLTFLSAFWLTQAGAWFLIALILSGPLLIVVSDWLGLMEYEVHPRWQWFSLGGCFLFFMAQGVGVFTIKDLNLEKGFVALSVRFVANATLASRITTVAIVLVSWIGLTLLAASAIRKLIDAKAPLLWRFLSGLGLASMGLMIFEWQFFIRQNQSVNFGLPIISTSSQWNGLFLTVFMAVISILLCFPLGVLLALGRQSSLPAIRWISTVHIEVIRGVPLISILFIGQVMIPLFLPEGIRPALVFRAIVGLTLFSAAYMAENIRGGLQAIPRGQIEAANALGLSQPLTVSLIILPQALKISIPAIVGQFISLFQDTTLLSIVGLLELLGLSRSILANPDFVGRNAEVYLFIAVLYWFFCYAMSLGSRRLEAALNTENR
jgi:His/Glu/Gln/Arg/opine family amino acid ABC transporter permease subunit